MPKDIEEIIVQPYMDAPPFPAPRDLATVQEVSPDDEEDLAQ